MVCVWRQSLIRAPLYVITISQGAVGKQVVSVNDEFIIGPYRPMFGLNAPY